MKTTHVRNIRNLSNKVFFGLENIPVEGKYTPTIHGERSGPDINLLRDQEKMHATPAADARVVTLSSAQPSRICYKRRRWVETSESRVGGHTNENPGQPQMPSGTADEGNAVSQEARECT